MKDLLSNEGIKALMIPVVLSLFGGAAGYALRPNQIRTAKQFLGEMVISIFAGMLMYFALENYKISDYWKAFNILMTGSVAREFLILMKDRFFKTVKKAIGNGNDTDNS